MRLKLFDITEGGVYRVKTRIVNVFIKLFEVFRRVKNVKKLFRCEIGSGWGPEFVKKRLEIRAIAFGVETLVIEGPPS